jgi:hypothetical protein
MAEVSVSVLAMHKRSGHVYYENHQAFEVNMDTHDLALAASWAQTVMHGPLIDKFEVGLTQKASIQVFDGKWVGLEASARAVVSCGHSLESLLAAKEVAAQLARWAVEHEYNTAVDHVTHRELQAANRG